MAVTEPFRIENMYAYLSIDPDDNSEGITATMIGGVWMPLIAGDHARLESLHQLAQKTATETGHPVRLVRFMRIADLDIVEP